MRNFLQLDRREARSERRQDNRRWRKISRAWRRDPYGMRRKQEREQLASMREDAKHPRFPDLNGRYIGFVVKTRHDKFKPMIGVPYDSPGDNDSMVHVIAVRESFDSFADALATLPDCGLELAQTFTVPMPTHGVMGHWLAPMFTEQNRIRLILPEPRRKTRLMLAEFDRHQKIGIDFDGTLVGHRHSALIQRYILDHPEKEFHIVTFRSHGWQNRIEFDLAKSTAETGVPLTIGAFTAIHNMTDEGYATHIEMKGDPKYYAWKGVTCAQVGCTILLDDMADGIHIECVSQGVTLFSPDDFDL